MRGNTNAQWHGLKETEDENHLLLSSATLLTILADVHPTIAG